MKLPDDKKQTSATTVAISSAAVPAHPKRKGRSRKVLLLSVLVLITAPLAGRLLWMTIFLPLLPVTTFHLPLLMRGDIPGLQQIIPASDGNLWFLPSGNPWIGRITPEGVLTKFPLKFDGKDILSWNNLQRGADGTIWASSYNDNGLWQIPIAYPIKALPST